MFSLRCRPQLTPSLSQILICPLSCHPPSSLWITELQTRLWDSTKQQCAEKSSLTDEPHQHGAALRKGVVEEWPDRGSEGVWACMCMPLCWFCVSWQDIPSCYTGLAHAECANTQLILMGWSRIYRIYALWILTGWTYRGVNEGLDFVLCQSFTCAPLFSLCLRVCALLRWSLTLILFSIMLSDSIRSLQHSASMPVMR